MAKHTGRGMGQATHRPWLHVGAPDDKDAEWMVYALLAAAIGLVAGALAAMLAMSGRVRAERQIAESLRKQLDEAAGARVQLAELRAHLSGLRHDIRGILSPVLLMADRLLNHEEPGVRRAGDVMVRTVDRATARLAETRLNQENSDQG